MQNKEHLTIEGLKKLGPLRGPGPGGQAPRGPVAFKAEMNLGLSEKLKAAFPEVVYVVRSDVNNQLIAPRVDPN